MAGGAFLISREVFENDLWTDTTKFRIFFFIVGNAVFAEEGVKKAGVHIKRGQYLRSLRNLREDLMYYERNAEKLYGMATLNRKINELVNEGRLQIEHTKVGTLFTVVNYEKYQGFDHYKSDSSEQQRNSNGTPAEQQRNNNNNVNNVKQDNKYINNMSSESDTVPYKEVIEYLNYRTGKNYTATAKKTRELIKARFNDGFNLDDFKIVIDKKTSQWLNDPKMDRYLRPPTLFGTKFEGYLNERGKVIAINKPNSREERTALNTFGVDVGF